MRKSQVSLEYLMLIGIILVIMIPIFYYAITESTEQIRLNQAEDAVNSLAKTADSVYALGPGSKDYVTVTIPSGISGSYVNNNEVSIRLDISGTSADIVAFSKAEVTGQIPIARGTYSIPVEMLPSGIVQIGEGNDTIAPVIVFTYPSGKINFNDITIRANTNEPALCKYSGTDSDYTGMGNDFVGSLMSHESYLGILDEGNHLYYARCMDPGGNIMQSSAMINFTINTSIVGTVTVNETFEPNPPVITLISPEDDYTDDDGAVLFQFNVSDESSIAFCELIFNRTAIRLITGINKTSINNAAAEGLNYGYYNWSINCTDIHGNKGRSAERAIFINHTQDLDLPVVYLMSPDNGTIRNYWLVRFYYNVTDASSDIGFCTLHMDGVLDDGGNLSWNIVDSGVIEDSTETITIPLFKANYTWQVSCTDTDYNANTGYSDIRNIRVNITAGEEAFINSCEGWCGIQGFTGGKCENNDQKCDDVCGLPYSQNNDCYAGDTVSQEYCLGGSEADSCCCIL